MVIGEEWAVDDFCQVVRGDWWVEVTLQVKSAEQRASHAKIPGQGIPGRVKLRKGTWQECV